MNSKHAKKIRKERHKASETNLRRVRQQQLAQGSARAPTLRHDAQSVVSEGVQKLSTVGLKRVRLPLRRHVARWMRQMAPFRKLAGRGNAEDKVILPVCCASATPSIEAAMRRAKAERASERARSVERRICIVCKWD